ncbi:MAG: shikimate dehydrogenase family protein [Gemmatimonadota bacterium]
MISGRSRLIVLLGNPVGHSLSPAMQNAAFRVLGLDAVYAPLCCAAEDVPAAMDLLVRAGGGGNVTVPHKSVAAAHLAESSTRVMALGACNTFWPGDLGPAGDNTDVDGVLEALHSVDAPGSAWLVVGTGGSARAVVAAAAERGAALAVRSRDPERQRAFAAFAASLGVPRADPAACEVVINATPLGLGPRDPLPLAPEEAPAAVAALDLVYARGETPWVRAMRARGCRAADGRGVLVAQGASSLERWFPGVRAPVEVMRAAVNDALR